MDQKEIIDRAEKIVRNFEKIEKHWEKVERRNKLLFMSLWFSLTCNLIFSFLSVSPPSVISTLTDGSV